MPNHNAASAKKQALAMAVLQHVIYCGGAKVSNKEAMNMDSFSMNSDVNISKKTSTSHNQYASSALFSHFAVNVTREYNNQNGEYFVLCDFKSDKQSKNTIQITTYSESGGSSLVKYTNDSITKILLEEEKSLFSEIRYLIDGVRCEITTNHQHSLSNQEDTTRIDGTIAFNNGFNYPDFNITKGLKEQTFFDHLDLSSNSLGYAQQCFVTSIPIIANRFHASTVSGCVIHGMDSETTTDTSFGCQMTNRDSLSIPMKIKWGGIRKGRLYYSNFEYAHGIGQDITKYICQYSIDDELPSLIISKHFSFLEAMSNLCLCLPDSINTTKPDFSKNKNSFDMNIRNLHLFPLLSFEDEKCNQKFNGVVLSSDVLLPFDINRIRKSRFDKEDKRIMNRVTKTFSPLRAFASDKRQLFYESIDLPLSGISHQLLLLQVGGYYGGFPTKTIEMYGVEITSDKKDKYILSTFWNPYNQ